MGIFDGSKSEQIKFLEEERVKLWERLTKTESLILNLQKEIELKTPEIEKIAKGHSKKAAEFRNKTEERLKETEGFLEAIQIELEEVKKLKSEISEISKDTESTKSEINDSKLAVEDQVSEINKSFDQLQSRIQKIDEVYEKYPNLDAKIQEINELIENVESNKDKSTQALKSINSTRVEIQNLHREIFGYQDTNEENEEVFIEGKKDALENAYKDLEDNIEKASERVELLEKDSTENFEKFSTRHQKKYDEIIKKINTLLPGALTAGLSTAFADKKEAEIVTAKELKTSFQRGIYALVGASLMPIIISIVLYYLGYEFEKIVLEFVPRLVLTFVPLYLPILWFAYSANKKFNLSKRLIEEYSHKEVLSKTYQGLANQINELDDEYQSEELKLKLLNNFLQITSENPGKLISNYQVSDHPIMEALEQAYKYEVAVEKLEGIPGMGKIKLMLSKKAEKYKKDAKEMAEGISENGEEDENKET